MNNLNEIIRLLEHFNLKVIAEAADSEELKNQIIGYLKGGQVQPLVMPKIAGKWVSIKDRLPEEYVSSYLYCQYDNGNTARAIGSYYDGEWEIEWSDDHPDAEDIKYWFEEEP